MGSLVESPEYFFKICEHFFGIEKSLFETHPLPSNISKGILYKYLLTHSFEHLGDYRGNITNNQNNNVVVE